MKLNIYLKSLLVITCITYPLIIFFQRKTIKYILKQLKNHDEVLVDQIKDNQKLFINQYNIVATLEGIQKNVDIITNQSDKLYLIINLLKNSQSYSISKTISKILESQEVPSVLEANILFLEHLKEEYTFLKEGLIERIKNLDDNLEFVQKNKLKDTLIEIENILLFLSTISKDSTSEYVSSIFKEISASFYKIHKINSL